MHRVAVVACASALSSESERLPLYLEQNLTWLRSAGFTVAAVDVQAHYAVLIGRRNE